jgi:hypothetical protein
MNKYEPPSWRRWNPQPTFYNAVFHPAVPGTRYTVRHGDDGEEFEALFSYDRHWYKLRPRGTDNMDAVCDHDPTELVKGELITPTNNIQWKGYL